ncbi:MAG: hypothetical protein ACRDG3_10745 [Tepidiformaceae bacterium]
MTTARAHPFNDFRYPPGVVDAATADLRGSIAESGVARLTADGQELGFVFSAEAFECLQGLLDDLEIQSAIAAADWDEANGLLIPHEQVVADLARLFPGED